MTDETIRSRFSAAASSYDQHARVQDQVAEGLMAWMQGFQDPARVLEFGCGTGRLTGLLCERFPRAVITAVDLSEAMLEQARKNVPDENRIEWIASDVCDFRTSVPFPLIVSSSALHWVTPIDRALAAIDQSIVPGGQIVLAIMLRETLGELHDARMRVAPVKPPQSRLPTMPDLVQAALDRGWRILRQSQRTYPVRYATAAELLKSIHDQGLTGGFVSRSHRPLTRGELSALIEDYESNYRDDDGDVVASFQVGFLCAEKAG